MSKLKRFSVAALVVVCALVLSSAGKGGKEGKKAGREKAAVEAPPPPPKIPMLGDFSNGERIFQVSCASCHGSNGKGRGAAASYFAPPPADLTDSADMLKSDDDGMIKLIMKGGPAVGKSAGMPAFSGSVNIMSANDALAYVRGLHRQIEPFFPDATRYIMKNYEVTSYGLERVEKALERKLNEAEKIIPVITVYGGGSKTKGKAKLIGQTPKELTSLKKKEKIGYLTFVPFSYNGETIPLAMAVKKDITIVRLDPAGTSDPKLASELDKLIGSGKRGDYKPLAMKGMNPKLLAAVTDSFLRGMEAVYAFEVEEKERTWADEEPPQ